MKPGLVLFIFLSATIHVVALNLNSERAFDLNKHNEQGRSSFSVQLIHPDRTINKTSSSDKKPKIIKKSVIAVKNKSTQTTLTETSLSSKPVKERTSERPTEKSITPLVRHVNSPDKQVILDNFLKAELDKFFYYPKSAIRRNWQGDLIISFSINHDGKISDIKILKTSGYDILDMAAINSVEKINLPENSLINYNRDTLKSFPVSYRLD
ncbi:MAG: TonB family protein [Gammaproteobacteria bacterium]|nr:TonB family protein [Gammaproteobacteria bacterium]